LKVLLQPYFLKLQKKTRTDELLVLDPGLTTFDLFPGLWGTARLLRRTGEAGFAVFFRCFRAEDFAFGIFAPGPDLVSRIG
jgi:hypothetical protein